MPETLRFGPPIISVDVEDWPQSTWDRSLPVTERAATNTRRVVQLLAEAGVSATMFVLGRFAEEFPEVVREIRAAGHEVASHGYGHVEIFKQCRREFQADVSRSKDLLEQILGESVRGYRAPDFSVVRETLWALEVLAELGFEYDSSIFPVQHTRYGIPRWPVFPVRVRLASHVSIVEFPIATLQRFNKNWPMGGGGYHRLLPGVLSRPLAKTVMDSTPFVFYCHPYEFDPREFKEISLEVPWRVRLHQGLGRSHFTERFRQFLRRFGGRPFSDLLLSRDWPEFAVDSLG